ncbi:hypothetical protein HMPREF1634_04820 [Tissierellia bacterium S7-1-4]|nr:hypothetical protein HMPREF1634_04820 [Tissierellia bacterium S7-1-4]
MGINFRSPSPRERVITTLDWLAGLVSEIPKRASVRDARLVNLTASRKLDSTVWIDKYVAVIKPLKTQGFSDFDIANFSK